ncbi:MarR family transcriptional regulator [Actinacidiphila sp. DG2A-62]|uniref:MarR family winged helix-turn-helix transcriptional regulator n=1 Tax=Actinacidiphila sp. DG2A-62 TaxID=3108821 RepID=UPI002DB563A8|nr:MarR family transcriptional regulator [Actinacidiphila sp. DG2A-62]MEC3997083.1 MarR family transcriptional regulator [Actinacidiphila sp. DG2A-62]
MPLESTLGHLLRRAQQAHTALWTLEFSGDVTGPQIAALTALVQAGALDQNTLGQIVSLDKATTAGVCARLERDGWIRRVRDPLDARRNAITPTPATQTSLRYLWVGVEAVQRALLEPLSLEERPGFVDLLAALAYAGNPPTAPERTDGATDARIAHMRLETTPGHLIRRAEQVHATHWQSHVGSVLTPAQYGLLTAVATDARLDQREAGQRASLDKSSTSDIVGRLMRRGLLDSEFDPADRRRKLLRPAAGTMALLTELEPAVRKVNEILAEPFSPAELKSLLNQLRRVAYR